RRSLTARANLRTSTNSEPKPLRFVATVGHVNQRCGRCSRIAVADTWTGWLPETTLLSRGTDFDRVWLVKLADSLVSVLPHRDDALELGVPFEKFVDRFAIPVFVPGNV